jgi:hypothetical protein
VCEAAERMPGAYGLSHNAQCEGATDNDGVWVIDTIVEVRSVDLVADAGTTQGLFESKRTMKTPTIAQWLKPIVAKLARTQQRLLKPILEGDDG